MNDLARDWFVGLQDPQHLARVVVRLVVACTVGGVIGFEREYEHKTGGMRTHMLVALGAALFVVIAVELKVDASRVIQGIAAGIGFLGAGMIFKVADQHEAKGLTSAASVWVTASVGVAVGVGLVWPALVAVLLGWFILYTLHHFERWLRQKLKGPGPEESGKHQP